MSSRAKELARCKKNLCPKCGSNQIEGQEVEIMPGSARQDVSCLECDAEWAEFYTLDHFSFYEKSDPLAQVDGHGCIDPEPCDHAGHVVRGTCERCGKAGLESDAETYEKENPWPTFSC